MRVCPNCQKPVRPEGGTVAGHVQREVNCGYTESTRNLLPELFSEFAKVPRQRKTRRRRRMPTSGPTRWVRSRAHPGLVWANVPDARLEAGCSPRCAFTLIPHTQPMWEGSSADKADKRKHELWGRKAGRHALPGCLNALGRKTLEKGDRVYIVGASFTRSSFLKRLQGDRVPFFQRLSPSTV